MVRRVVTVALLLAAAGLVWLSASYKGSPEAPSLTDAAVVRLVPQRDATALRQDSIGIELAPSWVAELKINGVDIPDDEVEQLNGFFFTPGKGKVIEQLAPGLVQVTAFIWRPAFGESRDHGAHPVSWTFHAA